MQQHYERMPTTIDPNLLMARNIAHYGENTASMIRGQYESGAYSSSKETIAGDFATAKQMASRPPFPPTPNSKDTRMSPHQQEGGKRFSPALSHHPAAGHLELLPPALAATMMQYGQGFPPQVREPSTQKNATCIVIQFRYNVLALHIPNSKIVFIIMYEICFFLSTF